MKIEIELPEINGYEYTGEYREPAKGDSYLDYEGKDVVGKNLAGQLKIVEYIKNKSTTKTIHKIQQSN